MCTVTTFVLVPGAGGEAWYWHRVVPLLQQAGHRAIAVDLPGDDEAAGLPEYVAIVRDIVDAQGRETLSDLVLVGQSLGGFTAAWVAAEREVRALVFVNAMIPVPGETAGAWWGNVGQPKAAREAAERGGYPTEFDERAWFLHDVEPEVVARGESHQRDETGTAFSAPWPVQTWPELPIHVLAGTDDRLFPLGLQQRVARERLGAQVTALPGGHLMALSQPDELAAYLLTV